MQDRLARLDLLDAAGELSAPLLADLDGLEAATQHLNEFLALAVAERERLLEDPLGGCGHSHSLDRCGRLCERESCADSVVLDKLGPAQPCPDFGPTGPYPLVVAGVEVQHAGEDSERPLELAETPATQADAV